MKKKNPYLIIASGVLLILGMIGFSISPVLFDTKISELEDQLNEYKQFQSTSERNVYDAMDWWRHADNTLNFHKISKTINSSLEGYDILYETYLTQFKFALNSAALIDSCANGNLEPDVNKMNQRWRDLKTPKQLFDSYQKVTNSAHASLSQLNKKIVYKKNQISKQKRLRNYFWIFCIVIQMLGLLFSTINEFSKK